MHARGHADSLAPRATHRDSMRNDWSHMAASGGGGHNQSGPRSAHEARMQLGPISPTTHMWVGGLGEFHVAAVVQSVPPNCLVEIRQYFISHFIWDF